MAVQCVGGGRRRRFDGCPFRRCDLRKNLHAVYYPASITKILTALIVIEHCNLDDVVTFPTMPFTV